MMSADHVEDAEIDPMTQSSEEALDALTQGSPVIAPSEPESPHFIDEETRALFERDRKLVAFDGVAYESGGVIQPLAFFRSAVGSFTLLIGRGLDVEVDIVVPSDTGGKCGVSRAAFRLIRSDTGEYSIVSTNTVPFFLRGPKRCLRIEGVNQGGETKPVSIGFEDKMCYNSCSIFLVRGEAPPTSKVFNVSPTSTPAELNDSTKFLLDEAMRGLMFVRDSSDPQARNEVLPHIISSLTSMVSPRVGEKRSASAIGLQRGSVTQTGSRSSVRRRYGRESPWASSVSIRAVLVSIFDVLSFSYALLYVCVLDK